MSPVSALHSFLPIRAVRRAAQSFACVAALAGAFSTGARAQGTQPSGSLDTSFTSILSGATVYTLLLQNLNGRTVLFAGGDFAGGEELNLDGTAYSRFVPIPFGNAGRIFYTAVPEVLPAGSTPGIPANILIGGLFGRTGDDIVNDRPAKNIARVFPDGAVDNSFDPGAGANNFVTSILPLPDGGMVVGGLFQEFNKETHRRIVRLDSTGAIVGDNVFSSGLEFNESILALAAQQPVSNGITGQILAAGTFSAVNGQTHQNLARINSDGSVDESFQPSFDARVCTVVSQPDGKILVGGDFETVNGVDTRHIARLNYDGSLDTTFSARVTTQPPGISAPTSVYVIKLLADGSLYAGGNFSDANGVRRRYLARFFADGTLDDFDPGTALTNAVQSLAVQDDNRLLVGETLSKRVNDRYPASLVRLYVAPTLVSVTASRPVTTIKQDGMRSPNGRFRLERSGSDVGNPLVVYVSVGGNAKAGVKYRPLNLTPYSAVDNLYKVEFPAGVQSLIIPVVPTKRPIKSGGQRTVTLTLVSDPTDSTRYDISSQSAATVTITN